MLCSPLSFDVKSVGVLADPTLVYRPAAADIAFTFPLAFDCLRVLITLATHIAERPLPCHRHRRICSGPSKYLSPLVHGRRILTRGTLVDLPVYANRVRCRALQLHTLITRGGRDRAYRGFLCEYLCAWHRFSISLSHRVERYAARDAPRPTIILGAHGLLCTSTIHGYAHGSDLQLKL